MHAILLCLSLLTGHLCIEVMDTFVTNDATNLRQNFKYTSPGSADVDARYGGNFSRITSGTNTADQTQHGNFNNESLRFESTKIPYNSETIYATSTGIIFNTNSNVDTTKDQSNGDLRHTVLLSETTFRISENDLNQSTSEVIDTTHAINYSHVNTLVEEFKNDREISNGNKMEAKQDENKKNEDWRSKGKQKMEQRKCVVVEEDNINSLNFSQILIYTIWSIIGFIGIGANICLCMVFVFRKEMRTTSNLMVLNLAISDILSIVLNIPATIIHEMSSSWQIGEFFCKIFDWARYLLVGSNAYFVVMVSLQRFCAVTTFYSFSKSQCLVFSKYKSIIVVILVWILSGALALRYSVSVYFEEFQCYRTSPDDAILFAKRNSIINWIVYCVIPLLIIGVVTTLTSIRLKKSAQNMPGEFYIENNSRRDRAASSKVLLALTIVFAISYIPMFSYDAYAGWREFYNHYLDLAFYGLLLVNSCCNPIALFLMSRKYRKNLSYIMCKKRYGI